MFDRSPLSKQYFPQFRDLSSAEAFRNNLLLRAHNIHVINMLDQVVKSVHNKAVMDALIVDTGKRHFNRHVTIELLQVSCNLQSLNLFGIYLTISPPFKKGGHSLVDTMGGGVVKQIPCLFRNNKISTIGSNDDQNCFCKLGNFMPPTFSPNEEG